MSALLSAEGHEKIESDNEDARFGEVCLDLSSGESASSGGDLSLGGADLTLEDAQKAERGIALASSVVAYKDLMMTYSCAAKIVQTKFEILDEEFRMRRLRNPIHSIDTRLKSTASIMDKLHAKELEPTEENIIEHVRDVAGVRIVCSYVDDIYMLAEAVGRLSGIEVLETKDYIAHPKPSGYRSLHLVLDVPVSFSDHEQKVKVEVQIRTIAMDFWASLEHQLQYKRGSADEDGLVGELARCASDIARTDENMMAIRRRIEAEADMDSLDVLAEHVRRLDRPF